MLRHRVLRWLLPMLAFAGCEATAPAPVDGGGAHGGEGGGTGGTIVGGAGPECLYPFDCPGHDSECRVRTCTSMSCGWADLAEGTPTAVQTPSDCRLRVCDGKGGVKLVLDTGDTLDDHNACTLDVCVTGGPRNEPWVTSACGPDGKGVCDGHGSCVACVITAQCSVGAECVNNRCLIARCLDDVKNGDETAVDCGGSACGPCAATKACLRDRDCESGICDPITKLCRAAACNDGVKNGGEADVDCGGPCAMLCGAGRGCHVHEDCLGAICSGAVCLPSCVDGVKNGAETGKDCGGSSCVPCPAGSGCHVDADCETSVCQSDRCVPPSCVNGAKDTGESDVDCGGPCAPCASGKGCAAGSDCASAVCAGTLCASPSCSDKTRNGGETGVDCGGSDCSKCENGEGCAAHTDCASSVCSSSVCAAPGCNDGVKEPAETDVDCGGACPPCGPFLACVTDADCASKRCVAGKCTAAACDDHIQNGTESDVDCGGLCAPCPLDGVCLLHEDCETIACAAGHCVPPSCTDEVRNGDETGTDCGGPTCGKCPGGQGCAGHADCKSGTCDAGVCAASCTDGVKDGDETDTDCGGSCDGCPAGGACDIDDDCDSGVCQGGVCAEPTCDDGVKNGGESDADCGGLCGPCDNGRTCTSSADCISRGCRGGVCTEVLLISEVRTNGPHAGALDDEFADEIVELYNPGDAPILLDASWKLQHQSAQGSCQGKFLRYQGDGTLTVPAHGHLLLVGMAYGGTVTPDAPLLSTVGNSIADAASLWIEHGAKIVDVMCYYFDDITLARLTNTGDCPPSFYLCQGTPISNLPHNGAKGGGSSVDVSLERKPGGALGNGQDTGDTAADFRQIAPAEPQNVQSPPTP